MTFHPGKTITLSKEHHTCSIKSNYICGQLFSQIKKCFYFDKELIKKFGDCNNDAEMKILHKKSLLGIQTCYKHEDENIDKLIKYILKEKEKK